jgi:hypothetical protein
MGAPVSPPAAVAELALHLGADRQDPRNVVILRQKGGLRQGKDDRPMSFTARQEITLSEPGFTWRARCGPAGMISVHDYLTGSDGGGAVRLLGLVPLARSRPSPALLKGEIMRYLGEIAWAPDAIVRNPALTWRSIGSNQLAVAAGEGGARGEVTLILGDDGTIASIESDARPRQEGSTIVERAWWGRFSNYERREGRLIPLRAEVCWVVDGEELTVFDCRITSWQFA